MARANPTRRSHREERSRHEETLSRDVDALQTQINTLGRRLSEAQAENERLRETLRSVVRKVERSPEGCAGDAILHTPQISKSRLQDWKDALSGGGDESHE